MVIREYIPTLEAQAPDIVFVENILARLTDRNYFGGLKHGHNFLTDIIQTFLIYHRRVPGGAIIWRENQPDIDEIVTESTRLDSPRGGIVHGIAIPESFQDLVYQNPSEQIKALIAAVVTARHQELNDFRIHSRPLMDAVETAQTLFDQALERNPGLIKDLVDSEGFEPSTPSMWVKCSSRAELRVRLDWL